LHVKKPEKILAGQHRIGCRQLDHNRGPNYICHNSRGGDSRDSERRDGPNIYEYNITLKRHRKFGVLEIIKNENGNTLIGLLVGFTLMIFLLMQPIDTFVFQAKHQMAESILHKYLARMRLEGYLTTQDENSLIADFNNIKCPIQNPSTDIIATAKESNGDNRILRSSDPVSSELMLQITCKPDPQPFNFMQLLGGAGGETTITVGGKELSERVNP